MCIYGRHKVMLTRPASRFRMLRTPTNKFILTWEGRWQLGEIGAARKQGKA